MADLIKQLMDNKEAFGLMSPEMQEKAKGIGMVNYFRLFGNVGWGGIIKDTSYVFFTEYAYRLRSDYEEKPEIVECEIYSKGTLYYRDIGGIQRSLSRAIEHPDFIGFKFEDGTILACPVMYHFDGNRTDEINGLEMEDVKILHATHVLFRRQT